MLQALQELRRELAAQLSLLRAVGNADHRTGSKALTRWRARQCRRQIAEIKAHPAVADFLLRQTLQDLARHDRVHA